MSALATLLCYTRSMAELGKTSDLVRRGAVYYCRRRCPKHLLRPGSKPELSMSLGTTDKSVALSRLDDARRDLMRRFMEPAAKAPTFRIFSRSLGPVWPTDATLSILMPDQAATLARTFFFETLRGIDAEPPLPSGLAREDVATLRVELEDRLARLTGPEDLDEIDHVFGAKATVLQNAGLRAEADGEACNLLHNYLRRAMAQAARIRLARLDGDFSTQITDALFEVTPLSGTDVEQTINETATEATGTTPLDPTLVDQWAKERKVSAKGVDKHRAVARWFRDRGGPIHVEDITKRDVLAFKNRMVEEGVSAPNANAKLSCLRTLLGYAVENALLDANPADRVNVLDKDKDRRKRKEFDLAALTALFPALSTPPMSDHRRGVERRHIGFHSSLSTPARDWRRSRNFVPTMFGANPT